MKSVRIWSFSDPYFRAFGLNTDIQSKCRRIQTRKTLNTDLFHPVYVLLKYFRGIDILSDIILYFVTATTLPPPFDRNFGNSLDQCLNPIEHPPNFCASQNVPDDAPTSFVRYRTINGTCNNLERGKATFGAAGIVAARFLPNSMLI